MSLLQINGFTAHLQALCRCFCVAEAGPLSSRGHQTIFPGVFHVQKCLLGHRPWVKVHTGSASNSSASLSFSLRTLIVLMLDRHSFTSFVGSYLICSCSRVLGCCLFSLLLHPVWHTPAPPLRYCFSFTFLSWAVSAGVSCPSIIWLYVAFLYLP